MFILLGIRYNFQKSFILKRNTIWHTTTIFYCSSINVVPECVSYDVVSKFTHVFCGVSKSHNGFLFKMPTYISIPLYVLYVWPFAISLFRYASTVIHVFVRFFFINLKSQVRLFVVLFAFRSEFRATKRILEINYAICETNLLWNLLSSACFEPIYHRKLCFLTINWLIWGKPLSLPHSLPISPLLFFLSFSIFNTAFRCFTDPN